MEQHDSLTVLQTTFIGLLKDNTDPRKYFTKKKYSDYFEQYCIQHADVFSQLRNALSAIDEEADGNQDTALPHPLLSSLAASLAEYARTEVDSCRFFSKGNRQAELNLFLITSIFPAILKHLEPYGEALCDEIKAAWAKAFPGTQLDYRTFEALNESFRGAFSFLTGK